MGSVLRALEIASLLLPCAVLVSSTAGLVSGCADRSRDASGGGSSSSGASSRGASGSGASGGSGDRDDERASPTSLAGYETIPVVNGGTITGSVRWTGEPHPPLDIAVPIHAERCGATQRSPVLSLGRRGGVASTVVWLEGIRRGRELVIPSEPITVALEDCAFRPHVVAVPVGAQVVFRNAESILHNVHAMFVDPGATTRTWFSEGLPQAGATHVATVESAGVVRLVDDAGHPWMLGWLHAFEHPYFAVSDADGRFQLTGIPPGQYVVRAWHEGILVSGETESGRPVYSAPIVLSRPVTVSTGHDTTVDFTFGTASAEAAGG